MAERTAVDAGRILLWVYGVFVVAAGSRSAVQLGLHADRAPLAYGLSVLAALVYAVGFVLLRRATVGRSARPAITWSRLELICVLAVGTMTVVLPRAFPEPTVWSWYGLGYLGVPVVLPIVVLVYLRRSALAG